MKTKISTLTTAVTIILGGSSFSASANLTSSATLDFTLGTNQTTACKYGTAPPCNMKSYNVTDIIGSYFSMDVDNNGTVDPNEKTPIGSFNGIHIGTAQLAGGSHPGYVDGTETPNIDNPWEFLGGIGMSQTNSPITVNGGSGDNLTLDMSGWNITWNGIASIQMNQQGAATINCTAGSSCSDTSSYTLDAAFHVAGAGFTTVNYTVHLVGQVSSVPVPAAVWLFGSGLLGLIGVSRHKKTA